jgi:hypothetical protein
LASMRSFSCDFLLVWNWEKSPENLQDQAGEGHETLVEINTLVPEYLKTASDKAARLYEVAPVFGELENPLKARNRLREAIKGCEEFFGKEDPRTLECMENLALVYPAGFRYRGITEDLFLRVIETRKHVQGMDHQDTLNSIAGLASIYMRQGGLITADLKRSLMSRIRDNVRITEDEMEQVARCFGGRLIKLLLGLKKNNIPVTEKVVKAAAKNMTHGGEVMTVLLDQRGNEVKITEEVVKAAAGHGWYKELMVLLLDRRGTEFKITEEAVKAAAGNGYGGVKIMGLLLKKRGPEVKITEEVVKAAAENEKGNGIIALFFDTRSTEVKITEEVVKAAARNRGGERIMDQLLKKRGSEFKITEEVVKAAAGNRDGGRRIMALLLDQRGSEVRITEEVIKKVVWSREPELDIMALLRERRGDEVRIAEEEMSQNEHSEGRYILHN